MLIHRLQTAVVGVTFLLMGHDLGAQESLVPVPEQPPQPPNSSAEDFQVLTRGPIHEAFAEQLSQKPAAGTRVDRRPPEPIDEIPPEAKPEGDDISWIPGYWYWDGERSDFIWISGVWRNMPPDRRWVPGYWSDRDGQFAWISGFWAAAGSAELEYVPDPPESLEAGPSSAAPSRDHFWIPGNWTYRSRRYAWRPGYWSAVHTGWMWVPAHYVWTPRGCLFVSGYWDFPFQRRGLLYGPVYFRRGYRHIRFRPQITISAANSFLHMFIQVGSNHFYFGDYYGAHYHQNFYPWYDFQRIGRRWDPFYSYLRYRQRRDGIDYLRRCHHWHDHYLSHASLRPRQTFVEQQQFARRQQTRDDVRRSTLAHGMNDGRGRLRKEQKLAADERARNNDQLVELRRLRRQRQRLENSQDDRRNKTENGVEKVAQRRRGSPRSRSGPPQSERQSPQRLQGAGNVPRSRRREREPSATQLGNTTPGDSEQKQKRRKDRVNNPETADVAGKPAIATTAPRTSDQVSSRPVRNRRDDKTDQVNNASKKIDTRDGRGRKIRAQSSSESALVLSPGASSTKDRRTKAPPPPRAQAGRVSRNERRVRQPTSNATASASTVTDRSNRDTRTRVQRARRRSTAPTRQDSVRDGQPSAASRERSSAAPRSTRGGRSRSEPAADPATTSSARPSAASRSTRSGRSRSEPAADPATTSSVRSSAPPRSTRSAPTRLTPRTTAPATNRARSSAVPRSTRSAPTRLTPRATGSSNRARSSAVPRSTRSSSSRSRPRSS